MEDSTVQPSPEENPVELAIAVAERVQLKFILLEKCETKRDPEVDSETKLTFKTEKIEFGKDEGIKALFVRPSFRCVSVSRDETENDSGPSILIACTFVLMYELDSFDGLQHRNLHAFAAINAVHNVWPYWREFVQSMSVRMGLAAITAPVLMFGKPRPIETVDNQSPDAVEGNG